MNPPEPCPKCNSIDFLKEKMILINKLTLEKINLRDNGEGFPGQGVYIDQCKEELVNHGPMEQFMPGLFCTKCGIGFIPHSMLKAK